MIYLEVVKDIFTVSDDYYFAQCISADFAMGKGIAVEFNKRFDTKSNLVRIYDSYLFKWDSEFKECVPCILEGRVFNLITKRNYWNKPTYNTMKDALIAMKYYVENSCCITKIAMPIIGCGLDGLSWPKVKAIIQTVFADSNIEILVCKQE